MTFQQEQLAEYVKYVLQAVQFKDYTFDVVVDENGTVYLQAHYDEPDTVTGVVTTQYTRKWLIEVTNTRSEIVATAFKCALTSMEHRTREWFKYEGKSIYQPHYDVDDLWEICE